MKTLQLKLNIIMSNVVICRGVIMSGQGVVMVSHVEVKVSNVEVRSFKVTKICLLNPDRNVSKIFHTSSVEFH